jgi:pyrroline-5-carboxylate reductase
MNEMIALNGSTPAFLYLFAKHFIDYSVSVGVDREIATELFTKTMIGSAEMIRSSGKSIDELITMVSSKGGTTLQGLDVFEKRDLKQTVEEAARASIKRAYELEK